MIDFEIILAIVVTKEVILSPILSPFNAREAPAAAKHEEHQNEERDKHGEVFGHFEESIIYILCLLARCIGVLCEYGLLVFVEVQRVDF